MAHPLLEVTCVGSSGNQRGIPTPGAACPWHRGRPGSRGGHTPASLSFLVWKMGLTVAPAFQQLREEVRERVACVTDGESVPRCVSARRAAPGPACALLWSGAFSRSPVGQRPPAGRTASLGCHA